MNTTQQTVAPYIEADCTFKFQGQSFQASGAVVTADRLVAYPGDGGILKDWHGKAIGTWREISSRRAVFFGHRSWVGERYYFMRGTVNGREYSLRGFGVGMVAMGKALKA